MKHLLILMLCGLLWGSQYEFNHIALETIPPIWVAALRSTIGAIVLIIAGRLLKLKQAHGPWPLLASIALLEATLPFLLVAWGQQSTLPSHAAVITGMNPLLTILLAPLLLRGATLDAKALVCGLLGFASLLYLFYPQLQTQGVTHFYGAAAIFCAALSFALSLILVKRLEHLHPVGVARDVIVLSAIQLLPVAWLTSELSLAEVSLRSGAASLYLGVFCGGVVYILFMQLIMRKGPAYASLCNYLVPSIGVLLSVMVQGSAVSERTWLSLAGILATLLLFHVWTAGLPRIRKVARPVNFNRGEHHHVR